VRPDRLVVASQNRDKVHEVEAVLSASAPGVEIIGGLEWPEVPETEATLEGNALLKARAVAAVTGVAALADDTGLEVAALGGRPGVTTARFAGPEATYEQNVDRLLHLLDGVEDRAATFRTVVALVDPSGREFVAHGALEGEIATERRGDGGFGYDPVFLVDGRTLAEIGEIEKNRMSHRARALQALVAVVWR
jgi:XTP/dITP diphosphohydrolase